MIDAPANDVFAAGSRRLKEVTPAMATVSKERLGEVFVEVVDTLVSEFDLIEFLQKVTSHPRSSWTPARQACCSPTRTAACS